MMPFSTKRAISSHDVFCITDVAKLLEQVFTGLGRNLAGADHVDDPLVDGVALRPRRAGIGQHELVRLVGRLDLQIRGADTACPTSLSAESSSGSADRFDLHAAVPVVGRDALVAFDDVAGDVRLAVVVDRRLARRASGLSRR